MAVADPTDAAADPAAGAPDTDTDQGDTEQGYVIELSCLPDGTYSVSGPEPLQEEAQEEQGEAGSEAGETFTSVGEALKGVLKIIKDNPMGGDGEDQFAAGYKAR